MGIIKTRQNTGRDKVRKATYVENMDWKDHGLLQMSLSKVQ